MGLDVRQLHTELEAALGKVFDGVDSTGKVVWLNNPTAEQMATAAQVIAVHDPQKRTREEAAERTARKAWARDALERMETMTLAEFRATMKKALAFLLREELKD